MKLFFCQMISSLHKLLYDEKDVELLDYGNSCCTCGKLDKTQLASFAFKNGVPPMYSSFLLLTLDEEAFALF